MSVREPEDWRGRVDGGGEQHARWHSVVQPAVDAASETASSAADGAATQGSGPGVALLGFSSDEGVRRNQGRQGASEGPAALRAALSSLAAHGLPPVVDAGDVVVDGTELEGGQAELGAHAAALIRAGHLPIVLGGGHEVAWASYLGIDAALGERDRTLGVLNIDAHFDLRQEQVPTSGTGFLQIAHAEQNAGRTFRYAVMGIAETGNTAALFSTAAELGVTYRTDLECSSLHMDAVLADVAAFIDSVDDLYLTLDLDVLPAWIAPGVSAPAAVGVPFDVVLAIARAAAASGKLALFDVAELNPSFDIDNRTARVAARVIDHLVRSLPAS